MVSVSSDKTFISRVHKDVLVVQSSGAVGERSAARDLLDPAGDMLNDLT
jgi:hypothetical protein